MLADGVQTLKEDIEVVAFLPGANYVFLLIAPDGDSGVFYWLAFVAAVVGAAFYNYLLYLKSDEPAEGPDQASEETNQTKEHPQINRSGERNTTAEDWDDPRDTATVTDDDGASTEDVVAIVLLGLWSVLLLVSMYFLHEFFSKDWVLPESLFFISVGVLALYFTELALTRIVDDYGE